MPHDSSGCDICIRWEHSGTLVDDTRNRAVRAAHSATLAAGRTSRTDEPWYEHEEAMKTHDLRAASRAPDCEHDAAKAHLAACKAHRAATLRPDAPHAGYRWLAAYNASVAAECASRAAHAVQHKVAKAAREWAELEARRAFAIETGS